MPKEEHARNIISQALGLSVGLTDRQTRLGLHHPKADHPDRASEAVAITTFTDQDLERLYGSIRKHSTTIGVPSRTLSWQISVDDTRTDGNVHVWPGGGSSWARVQ